MSKPVKIGFVLLSRVESPMPSTRIAALNIFPLLSESNILPTIIFEPKVPTECPNVEGLEERVFLEDIDVIVFQKVYGPSVEALAKLLSASGIKTIFSVCDVVEAGMCFATDATVVVTDYLKYLYPKELHDKIYVVHDGIEQPEIYKKSVRDSIFSPPDRMRAVIVTSASLGRLPGYLQRPDWLTITVVGRYSARRDRWQRFREARWNIFSQETLSHQLAAIGFYSNRGIVLEQWNPFSVYDILIASDIGIIPVYSNESDSADAEWRVKSENRLTMMMAIGLPVIAYPIPSYESVIVTGRNGFLAKSTREWSDYLWALRNPVLRKTIGDAARLSVIDTYSKQEQARKFIEVILRVLGRTLVSQRADEENIGET